MDITAILGQEFHLKKQQCETVLKLIDDGNTIPFIARAGAGPLFDRIHSEIRINRQRGGFITEFCYFLRKFADFAVEKAGAVGKAFLSAAFVKKQRHSIMKPHGESAIMHLGMVRIL